MPLLNTYNARIDAFNIQVFGTPKASKPEVMEVLAKIIRTHDIIAIQEIRDYSQTAQTARTALPSLPSGRINSRRV